MSEILHINDVIVCNAFYLTEFECPCCQLVKIDGRLVNVLSVAKKKRGALLEIHSGYRCAIHNLRVGGKVKSKHLEGKAVDIGLQEGKMEEYIGQAIGEQGYVDKIIVITEKKHLHVMIL
jgi:hypothetical protein